MEHYSVLLQESIDLLDVRKDKIYVDATLGRGGHSLKILEQLDTGHLYSFDKDIQAINESKVRLSKHLDKITFIHSDFMNIRNELNKLGVNCIDGIIMDLGVSSPQLDDAARGFSYRFDAKLDMRMDQGQELDAYKVVNEYDFHDLMKILYKYGEESFAKQIARNIEKQRQIKKIETTFELVDVIKNSLPMKVKAKKGHPCKKSFQAIRIEVNHELLSLEVGLKDAIEMLNENGRACVITFHSLEDRITKQMFNEYSSVAKIDKKLPLLPSQIEKSKFKVVNKKVIVANNEENKENNRSHSAKLRMIERIGEN